MQWRRASFVKAFADAFRGIATLIATQRHAKAHLLITAPAVVLGFVLHISPGEWCAIVLAVGLVMAAEALNTAVEFLADAVHPEQHPLIGKAKDVAAGGVLLAAIAAVTVGLIVFAPRLLPWIVPNS